MQGKLVIGTWRAGGEGFWHRAFHRLANGAINFALAGQVPAAQPLFAVHESPRQDKGRISVANCNKKRLRLRQTNLCFLPMISRLPYKSRSIPSPPLRMHNGIDNTHNKKITLSDQSSTVAMGSYTRRIKFVDLRCSTTSASTSSPIRYFWSVDNTSDKPIALSGSEF